MRNFVPFLRSGLLVRVAVVALVSAGTAACSSDSSRFGESPFSNPFNSASREPAPRQDPYATGSVQAAPSTRVQRAPLGALPAAQARPMNGFDGQAGTYGQGGAYRQSRVEPQSTGSVGAPRSGGAGWSPQNGTMVTLGRGDSIHSISQRYGVPASAIMQANGLQNANGVGEGRQLMIPTYSARGTGMASAPLAAAPAAAAPAMMGAAPMVRQLPRAQAMATAPVVGTAANPKMQLVQGAQAKGVQSKPLEAAKPVKTAAIAAPVKPAQTEQAFAAQPVKPAVGTTAEANDKLKTAALKADPSPAENAGPSFRWPARGRVISAYGSKTNGSTNDGVNIAVPEGTEVKASDDGVVAYSGSELKGFGNLVLIRHSNGWVTAYAHNSALNVKRGDTVRRGQIIAKSGSTGSVSTPQLHFEVRKGSSTVDPMKHLPDA